MAKKKNKKSNRKGGWKAFGSFIVSGGQLLGRSLPFIAVAVIAGYLVFSAKQFLYADNGLSIQKINFEPAQALSIQQMQAIDAKYLGKNILKVNIQALARTLEKDPGIQSAAVSKKFPSELVIQLQPRVPAALIRFSPKGSYGVVSDDGMILRVTDKPGPSDVIIEAFESGLKEPSLGYQIPLRSYLESVKFLNAFAEHALASEEKVTKITLDHSGNVIINLRQGPPIHLGRRPSERLNALQEMLPLLNREDRTKIDYVDLQFDNVIVKRKG